METFELLAQVTHALGRALLPGFVDLIAEWKGDASYGGSSYMLSLGRTARLDDIRDAPEYLVVMDTSTSDDGKARIRAFAPIEKQALLDVAVERDFVFSVPSRGHEVRARRVLAVGSLELSSTPLPTPSPEEMVKVLQETIQDLGGPHAALVQTLSPDKRKKLDELCSRVRLAAANSKDTTEYVCFSALNADASGSGNIEDQALLDELLEPWLAAAGSLKRLDLYEILWGSLLETE